MLSRVAENIFLSIWQNDNDDEPLTIFKNKGSLKTVYYHHQQLYHRIIIILPLRQRLLLLFTIQ